MHSFIKDNNGLRILQNPKDFKNTEFKSKTR